jgi:myxalamid-type polyketide synthase MxaE and MxaD
MPAEAALTILGNLLASDLPQITVAAVDWASLKAAYEARRARPLLEGLESKKATKAPAKAGAEARKVSLADQLREIKPKDRRAFIVEHVRQQVARVISVPDPAALDIRQGLFEMGLDSLMSVELKGRLEASVEQPLPSTLTFNYPTIADLARYLDESVLAAASAPESAAPAIEPPPAEPASEPPAKETDDMSEDDLAALLAAKLSKLQ